MDAQFSDLLNKTLDSIEVQSDRITFHCHDGSAYEMYHDQDCCETVWVEDIAGDLIDLLNSPILLAEEVSNSDDPPLSDNEDSYTWTFYKLATNRGYATIRWYGTSNGYYSESVSFVRVS